MLKKTVSLTNKGECNAHAAKRFKTFNILMLMSIYELETVKLMFDCMHKILLKPLMEHFTRIIVFHDHNTRQGQAHTV